MRIYFIRHAQSAFNAVYDPEADDPMLFDARLSPFGERQARAVRQRAQQLDIERVIVSPLTRTLQTAGILFEAKFPLEVSAEVREQLSNSCDVGSSPEALAQEHPHLDFGHLETCWWHNKQKDHRGISVEPHNVLQERADRFIALIRQSLTHPVAIVSHGNFINAVTGTQAENCQIVEFDLDR